MASGLKGFFGAVKQYRKAKSDIAAIAPKIQERKAQNALAQGKLSNSMQARQVPLDSLDYNQHTYRTPRKK